MKLLWMFIVTATVFSSAFSAKNEYMDYDGWWSDEAPAEKLGLADNDEQLETDASSNDEYPFYDDIGKAEDYNENSDESFDLNDDDKNVNYKNGDVVSFEDLEKLLDEADAELGEKSKEINILDKFVKENVPVEPEDTDKEIQEEIEKIRKEIEEPENDNHFDDYQVEDNRSETKDEEQPEVEKQKDIEEPRTKKPNNEGSIDLDQVVADAREILKQKNLIFEEDMDQHANEEDVSEDKSSKSEYFEDIIENQQNEEIKTFLNKTKTNQLLELNKNEAETDEFSNKYAEAEDIKNLENNESEKGERGPTGISFIRYEDDMIDPVEDVIKTNKEDKEEETVDKDLEQLISTLKKIEENSNSNEDNVKEYEEEYGKPFREDLVLSQRDDLYDNYGDIDDDTFKDLKYNVKSESDSKEENEETLINTSITAVETPDSKRSEEIAHISSTNITSTVPSVQIETIDQKQIEYSSPVTYKTISVENLTREQYAELMTQFAKDHAKELNTTSDDFGRNIRAIHMVLTADDVVEIASPNYPSPYPTNNVVDWILEGDGSGIELNISELAVRGPQADFLLIKPGSLDESGNEGLIFSYTLNEPRLFRFTDVNKAFVRFQTGTGLSFLKGFHMTAKMIWPPEIDSVEDDTPISEPLLPEPPATVTVTLGGVLYPQFKDLKDEFRRIVADMGTMYITANGIDAGTNTTRETTQITSVATCNINWPNFENCVEVTFGIPLVYEDRNLTLLSQDHLKTMWETYVERDPFVSRLRSIGIQEFAAPNDSRVMLAWVVLAVGVVISAAMLALALWRYSCFENYTRMKALDTDPITDEKRNLDLYPTPHQTLPPLYTDNDMKWADAKYDDTSRVDVGGFTNRGYARDELLDIDSDEDVIAPRERNAGIIARDLYQV